MKKILIIDDDEGIKDSLKAILESEGFEVATASDETILFKDLSAKPGLILLDYFLGGKTGSEIAKSIRAHKSTKNIPIVMLSADPANRKKIPTLLVNDFLDKPFEMSELLDLANRYLIS